MYIAHITRVYFNVDEQNHTVAFANNGKRFADRFNNHDGCKGNFKAVFFFNKAADSTQLQDQLRKQLQEVTRISDVSDFSIDYKVQEVKNDGFWLDGYSGTSYYCNFRNKD